MENINLLLDIVLVLVGIWGMVMFRRLGLGGVIGSAAALFSFSALVLGSAHLIETITFRVMLLEITTVELIHRLIVLVGFVVLIIGFRKIRDIVSPQ